jgi:uncharacterized membrane protein
MAKKKTAIKAKKVNGTENKVLMAQAREILKGRWGIAVCASLLYLLIAFFISSFEEVGLIASLILSGPLALGATIFWLRFTRKQDDKLENIFLGFNNFGTSFIAYIIVLVFTLLWALLLIIPGIIAALSYSLTFYIIADDKSINAQDAVKKSKKMMYGYKWKLFCLYCRFIGWLLLCILTLGIGLLWLIPYVNVSTTRFYEDVKKNSN